MNRTFLVGGAISVLLLASSWSETLSGDTEAITATVEKFHDALARGAGKAAMNLLAPDAVILESGYAQSRADYEREHLPEDIKFAQAVSQRAIRHPRRN